MAERDPSELDLAAAFRAYLENAPTEVRATEVAHRFALAYPHGRGLTGHLGFRLTPAMAWLLLLVGLLAALGVGGLMTGSWRPDQAVVVVPQTPATSPTPAPSPSPWWTTATTGAMASARMWHTATLLPDGRVLVAGGMAGGTPEPGINDSAELYDPRTGTFGPTGQMVTARERHTATLLLDGRVLLAGGSTPGSEGVVATAELYDPRTGTFGPTGSMTTARENHTATLLPDGRVLVTGGYGAEIYYAAPLASAEIYDPKTGTFAPTGSMTTARGHHTASLLPDGRVLVVGGSPGGYLEATGYVWLALDSAELYDPMTGSFAPTGSMTTARYAHAATLLRDGRVLIAGGFEESTHGLVAAELYDPTTGTFSPTGPMTTGRGSATALLLPDGRVLVAGGLSAYTVWAEVFSAEIYEPATGVFGPTGRVATNRTGFTATLLPDGRVLRAGGFNGSEVLASADIFTP